MFLNCGVGVDSWDSLGLQGDQTSPSLRKSILNIHWKDWYWGWNYNTWPHDAKSWHLEKTLMLGKIEGRRKMGLQRARLLDDITDSINRHEFEQTLGDGEGQGNLVSCSPWGHKESDTTEWLKNKKAATGILCYFLTSFWSWQNLPHPFWGGLYWARSKPLFSWIWSVHFLSH